jgi:hypothetical protein
MKTLFNFYHANEPITASLFWYAMRRISNNWEKELEIRGEYRNGSYRAERIVEFTEKEEILVGSIIDYFADTISLSDWIEKNIKANFEIYQRQELQIKYILKRFIKVFKAAPCDAEGANLEQGIIHDNIIESCAIAILNVINNY